MQGDSTELANKMLGCSNYKYRLTRLQKYVYDGVYIGRSALQHEIWLYTSGFHESIYVFFYYITDCCQGDPRHINAAS
jgi:hypothetical protein